MMATPKSSMNPFPATHHRKDPSFNRSPVVALDALPRNARADSVPRNDDRFCTSPFGTGLHSPVFGPSPVDAPFEEADPMNKLILADNQAIYRAGTAKILAMEDD